MKKHAAVVLMLISLCLAGIPTLSFAEEGISQYFFQNEPIANVGAAEAPGGSDNLTCELSSAEDGTKTSGFIGRTSLSINELRNLWASLPKEPLAQAIYGQLPDVPAYSASTLSDSATAFSESYINFVRKVAGLGTVSFTQELNDNAAQGALISAKNNTGLSHNPSTPAGVTDTQAAAGKYACANSNLGYSSGYDTVLRTSLRGMMDDKTDVLRSTVGHRRWILDPFTQTLGIGAADADGKYYTDLRVCGTSEEYGSVTQGSADFEFIAWPASGNMPVQVFSSGTPWSVSLNSSMYSAPSFDDVVVTVTRESDGAEWTLDSNDAAGAAITDEYFTVSNAGYGDVSYCVIFNPGTKNIGQGSLDDSFTVSVSGLKLKSGEAASLTYEVDFVDLEEDVFERLSGSDRYGTMLEIVKEGSAVVTDKPVVLATGANYPDALSASALAGMLGGSVVLTASNTLPSQTIEALTLLHPSKVYVIGGTSAVSESVLQSVASYATEGAERIDGISRVQTAERVYEKGAEFGAWGNTCIVATSQSFADALSISPLAYKGGYPIFLTMSDGVLSASTLDLILSGGFEKVIIVGGENAVSPQIEKQLGAKETVRLAGESRYETNSKIVDYELEKEGFSLQSVTVATGENYPDALVGSALCGNNNSVMLLLKGNGSSIAPYETLLQEGKAEIVHGYVLGGENAVSFRIVELLNDAVSWE